MAAGRLLLATTPFATFAAICALAAALFCYGAVRDDHRSQAEAAAQAQLQNYLVDYAALRTSYDNAGLSMDAYNECGAYDLRLKASMAAAALLATAETMKDAGDRRADRWASFLIGYPGPVDDFGLLDAYATSDWGRQKLAAARAAIPRKRYPACPEPPITRNAAAVPRGQQAE